MELITKLFEISQKKNIPEAEVQIALSAFLSSAITQALEECKVTKEMLDPYTIEALENKIQSAQSLTDLQAFTAEFDTQVSSPDSSFLEVVERIFNQLLSSFLEKVENLK